MSRSDMNEKKGDVRTCTVPRHPQSSGSSMMAVKIQDIQSILEMGLRQLKAEFKNRNLRIHNRNKSELQFALIELKSSSEECVTSNIHPHTDRSIAIMLYKDFTKKILRSNLLELKAQVPQEYQKKTKTDLQLILLCQFSVNGKWDGFDLLNSPEQFKNLKLYDMYRKTVVENFMSSLASGTERNFESELSAIVLSYYDSMTYEKFIESNREKIWNRNCQKTLWDRISRDNISELFIIQYANFVNWDIIEKWQTLSEPFIIQNIDMLNLSAICANNRLSESFLENQKGSFAKEIWNSVCQFQILSCDFIRRNETHINFRFLSKNANLSESVMDQFKFQLHWGSISRYKSMSLQTIEKYEDLVDWVKIVAYQKLSEHFIEKHIDKINWKIVSVSQSLSEEFIERHAREVHWEYIFKYQTLSNGFIKKHKILLKLNEIIKSYFG